MLSPDTHTHTHTHTHTQRQLCEETEVLTNLTVVIIVQYILYSNHHIVYLKLKYMSIISQYEEKIKEGLSKWRDVPYSLIIKLNVLKTASIPTLIY